MTKTIIEYKNEKPNMMHECRRPIVEDIHYPTNEVPLGKLRKNSRALNSLIHNETHYAGHWLVAQLCDSDGVPKALMNKLQHKISGFKNDLIEAYMDMGVAPGKKTAAEMVKRVETAALEWASSFDDKAAELLRDQGRSH